jgi:hypothetical protein
VEVMEGGKEGRWGGENWGVRGKRYGQMGRWEGVWVEVKEGDCYWLQSSGVLDCSLVLSDCHSVSCGRKVLEKQTFNHTLLVIVRVFSTM